MNVFSIFTDTKDLIEPILISREMCRLILHAKDLSTDYHGTQIINIPISFLEICLEDFSNFVLRERLSLFKGTPIKSFDMDCVDAARSQYKATNVSVGFFLAGGRINMRISTWKD